MRVFVTGCTPFEITATGFWKIIFHKHILFFLAIIGLALATLLLPNPFALVLFALPFSVTFLTAAICQGLVFIAKRYPVGFRRYRYDGEFVNVRWLFGLGISLCINIFAIILIIEAVFNARVPLYAYFILPLFWIVASEVFSAFAVIYLLPLTGILPSNAASPPQREGASITQDSVPAEMVFPNSSEDMPWTIFLGNFGVNLQKPVSLRSEGNYVELSDSSGVRLVRTTLSSAVAKIRADAGLQIHRSSWVSFPACESLEPDGPDLYLHTTFGQRLKVAKPRQAHVLEQFKNRDVPAGA